MFAPGIEADLALIVDRGETPELRARLAEELRDFEQRRAAGADRVRPAAEWLCIFLGGIEPNFRRRRQLAIDAVRGRRSWLVRQVVRQLAEELRSEASGDQPA